MSNHPARSAIESSRWSGTPDQPVLFRLDELCNLIAEGAITVDAHGRVTHANRVARALIGGRADSPRGRDISELAGVPRGGPFDLALAEVLAGGGERTLMVGDTGASPFNVDFCRIIGLVEGGALILLGDIARTRAAAAPDARSRMIAQIDEIARWQASSPTAGTSELCAELHRLATRTVGDLAAFAIVLADDPDQPAPPVWSFREGAGPLATGPAALMPLHGAVERGWHDRLPMLTPSSAPDVTARLASLGVAPAGWSEIAAPIVHGNRTLGVLLAWADIARPFTADDADILAIVARRAAGAFVASRLLDAERRAQSQAATAATMARLALEGESLRGTARAALDLLERHDPVDGLALLAMDPADRELRVIDARGTLGPLGERAFVRPESLGKGQAASLAALRWLESDACEVAPDGLVLPLLAHDQLVGALAVSVGERDATARERYVAIAPSVALALHAQRLADIERRRRARESMLATALATLDQPVFILSVDRRVQYANDAAASEYGYPADDFAGMPFFETLVAHAQPMPSRPADEHTNVYVADHVHRRRDGTEFPASVALSFLHDDRRSLLGQVVSVRNLTGERRIAEQLRQSEKLAALGELVAGVAHELNNPLAGISAFAQLLLEEPLDDEQRESVRLIKRESDRAVSVIRDLLIFARKSGPARVPVNINALIELTMRLRAYSLRSNNVTVELLLDPGLAEVAGDDQKLQQVIMNLVVNAEHAMRSVAERRLIIHTMERDGMVEVEVIDSGPGMSPEIQQRIFEPFFTTKPPGEGTGLGLSVSYGIIEAHGGTIAASSTRGNGATFRVTLPVADPSTRNIVAC